MFFGYFMIDYGSGISWCFVFWNLVFDVSFLFIEFFYLRGRIENFEVGCGIGVIIGSLLLFFIIVS